MNDRKTPLSREMLVQIGIPLIWGMVGAALMVGAHHAAMGGDDKRPAIATVDLAGLIQQERERILRGTAQPNAAGGEEAAMARLKRFGARAEAAAQEVSASRRLILVQAQAIVAADERVPDVTDEVRRRLDREGAP